MPYTPPVGSLSRRITIALIPGIVTLLLVVATFFEMLQLRESRRLVEHTHAVRDVSGQVLQRVIDAETGVRAYALSGDPTFLEPYNGAEREVRVALTQLRQVTRDNPVQQHRVGVLTRLVDARFDAFRQGIATRTAAGESYRPSLARMAESKIVSDSIRTVLGAVDRAEDNLLAIRDLRDRWNLKIAMAVIGIGGALVVLISLIANGLLARTIQSLGQANADLHVQAQRLEEQATELETQATELEATAVELEASNAELEEQATELHEQRDVAQSARADAEQANAAKSRFLSVMSHELRTPLNAIAGYVDIMDAGVHGSITDDQREDFRRIKRAVAQLTSVINDILNFAKLESGEVRFDMMPVELNEALANAAALMEPQAAARGVRFRYTAAERDVVALADRERVQQIVLNLLSNAVKYTHPNGAVELACGHDDDPVTPMVRVRVSDTGPGIAPRDLDRIFAPFVQLVDGQHVPSEGVGLGLAISRDLARGMGGDLTVTSRVGQGSTFELTLPVAGALEFSGASSDGAAGADDDVLLLDRPERLNALDDDELFSGSGESH